MFNHTQEAFGQFIIHHIINKETDTGFSIAPGYGGIVLDIKFGGISILDDCKTPIELDLNRWGKSALLYPFPNRLKDGIYQWKGKEYQFPINDDGANNALHGLGMTKPMNATKVVTNEESGTFSCQYRDEGKHEYYPFPFNFGISFKITENTFEGTFSFENTGESSIPVGYGWHPYFALSEKVGECELILPELDLVGIDVGMIPTGKRYAFDEFLSWRKIGSTVLDNCFAIKNPKSDRIQIEMKGPKGHLKYWQEVGEGKYQYVQLFMPPHRESLAIEPMTCNVNAFNNGDGLIELAPGASSSASFGFSFMGNN